MVIWDGLSFYQLTSRLDSKTLPLETERKQSRSIKTEAVGKRCTVELWNPSLFYDSWSCDIYIYIIFVWWPERLGLHIAALHPSYITTLIPWPCSAARRLSPGRLRKASAPGSHHRESDTAQVIASRPRSVLRDTCGVVSGRVRWKMPWGWWEWHVVGV